MAQLESVFLGRVDYRDGWNLQRLIAQARRANEVADTLLLLEHPPVYTVGRNGEAAHLGEGRERLHERGADVIDVDRGGSVTFHGPGQLVAYPIVRVADHFPLAGHPGHGDVVLYLRALEEALIATVAQWGIVAVQRPPYTGIWRQPTADSGWLKLAAIGVKLAGGVTTHGAALNVTTDLQWFSHVVPCGIADAGVASIASVAHETPDLTVVATALTEAVANSLGSEVSQPSPSLLTRIDAALRVPVNSD